MKLISYLIPQLDRHWYFQPRLSFSIATLIILPILISLGCWQLDRWQQKKTLQQAIEANFTNQTTAKVIFSISELTSLARFTQVETKGEWLFQHSLFLDNQMYRHQAGFRVLTPFVLQDSRAAILIDRGWIPRNTDLKKIDLPFPETQQVIRGIINQPSTGIQLAANHTQPRNQQITVIDFNYFKIPASYQLHPIVLQLNAHQPNAFSQQSEPLMGLKPLTHLGYAIQWFGFAILLLVYFFIASCKRRGIQ